MKKHSLLLALALLFGAKAFAQEWEWSYLLPDYIRGYMYNGFIDAHELSDGRIIAMGHFSDKNLCGNYVSHHPALLLLDSNGTELAFSEYYKDGYHGQDPYVLENESGELYALTTFNPDHDTCSLNYYRNFDTITDHSILGLYKLNDDLSIAKSYEYEIPIDTFEWRNESNSWFPYTTGHAWIYSAFVDDDGSIVGVYYKSVSLNIDEPRGYDSTVFFRMDFNGKILCRRSYCGNFRSGSVPLMEYQRQHIVKADSLYLHYGATHDVVSEDDRNLAFLDYDFNLVRSQSFKHHLAVSSPGNLMFFQNYNVKRNRQGKTYMTGSGIHHQYSYCCALYEYQDDMQQIGSNTPISRYLRRNTPDRTYDVPCINSCVDILDDNSLYFAYTLDIGMSYEGDSRVVIERLTPEFETVSTFFIGMEDGICTNAQSIAATRDGGLILVTSNYGLYAQKQYCSITKFPAEAFLGVDEAHANGLKLAIAYPNPGGNEMHIRTTVENATVEVYDMNGRLVAQQPVTETETVLDATDWAAGTYIWKVVSSQTTREIESGKWVKK